MGRSVPVIMLLMVVATRAAFTGAFSDAPPRGAAQTIAAAPEGGWTFPYTDPRAIHREGVVYFGYIRGSDGSVVIAAHDEAAGTTDETVLSSALEVDDHDHPALLIRESDQRIMAFWTKHGDTAVRYKVSTNPLDISAFGAERTVTSLITGTYTYAIPVEHGGVLRLFSRVTASGDNETQMSVSSDDGATWATAVRLHDLTYTKVAVGDRVHILASDHPSGGQTSIYHFTLDADGTRRKSDGSVISASLPLQGSDMTVAYDGSMTRAWIWDAALDGQYPVAAFATFPGNDGSDHRARVARWDGSAWSSSEVAAMGTTIHTTDIPQAEPFYSGGVAIDRDEPDITYVSRKVGAHWLLYRYPGAVLLSASTGKITRPAAVQSPGRMRVLAMSGTYDGYLDYEVATVGG